MSQEKPNFASLDWEKIAWGKTPYKGVFLSMIEEKQDPNNPNIPLYTVMALKIESGAEIPLHRHNRELGWTETITLPDGGWFETKNNQKSKEIKIKKPFTIVIKAGEIFGLKNMNPLQPLYFYSTMKPGFTGYGEIEEIKDADSPALKP
jgi:hypothetical protein